MKETINCENLFKALRVLNNEDRSFEITVRGITFRFYQSSLRTNRIDIIIECITVEEITEYVSNNYHWYINYELPNEVVSFINNWSKKIIQKDEENKILEKSKEEATLQRFYKNFKGEA